MFGLVSCYVSDFKQKFAVAAIIKKYGVLLPFLRLALALVYCSSKWQR